MRQNIDNIRQGRSSIAAITHLLINIVISKSVIIHDGFIVTVYIVTMSRGRSVNVVEGARENLPSLACGMNNGYNFNIPHGRNTGGNTACGRGGGGLTEVRRLQRIIGTDWHGK